MCKFLEQNAIKLPRFHSQSAFQKMVAKTFAHEKFSLRKYSGQKPLQKTRTVQKTKLRATELWKNDSHQEACENS